MFDEDIFKILLMHPNINTNARTKNGSTPLILASFSGNVKVVELLCKKPGIDVNIENNDGKTAFDVAEEKGNDEIIKIVNDNSD